MRRSSDGGLSASDLRTHNLGLVLSHVDRAGAIARSELATLTGLAPGAITLLVSELSDAGLLREAASERSRELRPGRPRRSLEIAGAAIALLGLQFAVDEVRLSAVDLAGRSLLRDVRSVRTPIGDPAAVADQLAALVEEMRTGLAARGVTAVFLVVVVPAPVLQPDEFVPMAIDLGWVGVDLSGLLRERIPDLPLGTRVVNDANAAAYAEFAELQSRGERVSDMIYLKSDTGIGGGAITAGRPLAGVDGIAFEPGHIVVVPDGIECACGKRGCLVTVAGPDVVVAQAGLSRFRDEHGLPQALAELARRDESGDAAAAMALAGALRWIGIALANCVAILQPQFAVVGGYLADHVERLRELPMASVSSLGGFPGDTAVGIVPAALGPFSGVDGALLQWRRELLRDPRGLQEAAGGVFGD
ncbi:MAG: ROK family protein [Microbacterium sp.]|uniref:ROK family protein n=1 Tax=Microbacterium sp. TaxID=51671 RepID=UPI0039E4A807